MHEGERFAQSWRWAGPGPQSPRRGPESSWDRDPAGMPVPAPHLFSPSRRRRNDQSYFREVKAECLSRKGRLPRQVSTGEGLRHQVSSGMGLDSNPRRDPGPVTCFLSTIFACQTGINNSSSYFLSTPLRAGRTPHRVWRSFHEKRKPLAHSRSLTHTGPHLSPSCSVTRGQGPLRTLLEGVGTCGWLRRCPHPTQPGARWQGLWPDSRDAGFALHKQTRRGFAHADASQGSFSS